MTAITAVLAGIGAFLTGLWTMVLETIESGIGIFWDGTALTVIGALALMGLAIGLIKLGMGFIRGFFVR
jgi:hypothetical protein